MSTLTDTVQTDVSAFLQANHTLLFNERDLQTHLATWLRASASRYDDVDMEYYVPWRELEDYVWRNELKMDIVVSRGSEYVPVELKYKTRRVQRCFMRFGEALPQPADVMKNQGAQDLGMYDFWKDVRRIELVKNRFTRVKGGLAVFVTNDPAYLKAANPASNHVQFSMAEGWHATGRHWLNPDSASARRHPGFRMDRAYPIRWHQKEVEGVAFYYCIVII